MTIDGTGLKGAVSTLVEFTGPEDTGVFTNEPSVVRADGTRIIVFVPEIVTLVAGVWEVRVLANDGATTRTIGPATLTVIDRAAGPPIITAPNFLFAEAENSEGAVVFYDVTAVSASSGEDVPVECSPASGSQFGFGFATVTCTATEGELTSTAVFQVFVWDFTPPVIDVPDEHIVSESAMVTYEVSATDSVDGPVAVSCTPTSGSTFPRGTTRVLCTATDAHFNSSAETFLVTITGGAGRPVIVVPEDMIVEATGPGGAVVEWETESSGEEVTCTPSSPHTFPLNYSIFGFPIPATVTCSAENSFGTTTETFTVTVVDTTGPDINAPDVVAEATSASGALVEWDVTATDLVAGSVPVSCVIPGVDEGDPIPVTSPRQFGIGEYTIECTASDALGNVASDSFIITVADTTPPLLTLSVSPDTLFPPNHMMVPITVTAVATDLVDPAPVTLIVSVSSNQPINGTGDGDESPDWEITGALTLNLRAERAGGETRIYTITVQSTDLYGNTATETITVTVPASHGKR